MQPAVKSESFRETIQPQPLPSWPTFFGISHYLKDLSAQAQLKVDVMYVKGQTS